MIEFRPLASSEIGEAVTLWETCGLTRPPSDPVADAERAIDGSLSKMFGAFAGGHLIGAAMTGWDGQCGWIYYLGVEAEFRRWGVGRKLIRTCEDWLVQCDASKVQLTVRPKNSEATRFCKAVGYEEGTLRVFYRRLRTQA